MRLKKLEIRNFRRIEEAELDLSPVAFLVGPNNTGKSSVIAAVEALLSLSQSSVAEGDSRDLQDGNTAAEVQVVGRFGDVPHDVATGPGFKGRVIDGVFVYRKTWAGTGKPTIECLQLPSALRERFVSARTGADLVAAGLSEDLVRESLDLSSLDAKLSKGWELLLPETVEVDETAEPAWVKNPGGFPSIVASRLPRLIRVPALADPKCLDPNTGKELLGECLSLLFEDLLGASPLTQEIQEKLKQLEAEMNPNTEGSGFNALVAAVNDIIAAVFPGCGINVRPTLDSVAGILKPKYEAVLYSNVSTAADKQGTGLLRTAAFAMLRHHARFKASRDTESRPLIVAFEEPELYLHPAAGNLLRDTLYDLGSTDQIICTTHSPWMVDLSKDAQSITRMSVAESGPASATNYGVTERLGELDSDDRLRVKMLMLFDDEVSRVFFAERAIVVEGDSEVVAIREALRVLPEELRRALQAKFQVLRARGKAAIISVARYFKRLEIDFSVIHDLDSATAGAAVFNAPILAAVDDKGRVTHLAECLEDALGYEPPDKDKPLEVYRRAKDWQTPSDVPVAWQHALARAFDFEWPDDEPSDEGSE